MPSHGDFIEDLWMRDGFGAVYQKCKQYPYYIEAAMNMASITSADFAALAALRRGETR